MTTGIRYSCPLPGCGWRHDVDDPAPGDLLDLVGDPTAKDFPSFVASAVERTAIQHAAGVEKVGISHLEEHPLQDLLAAIVAERDKAVAAEARVARARALHRPVTIAGLICCDECSTQRSTGPRTSERIAYIPYPCRTVQALDQETP